jgi:hypothetical protein
LVMLAFAMLATIRCKANQRNCSPGVSVAPLPSAAPHSLVRRMPQFL